MKSLNIFVICGVGFIAMSFPVSVLAQTGGPAATVPSISSELAKVIFDYEAFDRSENPIASGQEGDRIALSKLPGVAPSDDERRRVGFERFKVRLARLADQGMNDEERFNFIYLKRVVDMALEDIKFDANRLGFTNEGGPEWILQFLESSTVIRSNADAEAYLARLEAVQKFFADTTENVRRGVRTGFIQPRTTTELALLQFKASLQPPTTGDGGLMLPLTKLPGSISLVDQKKIRDRARSIIESKIRPAQKLFTDAVETEVLPASKPDIGALHHPGGRAYYTYLVKLFTTTSLTPEQVYEIGLQEVARIRTEMEAEMRASGFKGTFPEFLAFLRAEPRFYAKSREELLEKSARIAKRADDELPKIFKTLPRLPYGVREVSREIEENYTTAKYQDGSPQLGIAGGLMVNTSHLDQRPLYEHPALLLHEGVPGHHLQIAIQQELDDQPWFRRQANVTAYVEGWGLYAEFLGYDMGIYRDSYERFGKLSMEMWRACRLLVDTGIHWKGWTIEQARSCFTVNTAMAPKNIENEVQRYIAWPGQALAYKIGEMKLRELRKKAESELGANFDLRRFHDAVLWVGPLPLDLLEMRIKAWIAKEQAVPNR